MLRSSQLLRLAAGGAALCVLLPAAGSRAQGPSARPACNPEDYLIGSGVPPPLSARGAVVPMIGIITEDLATWCRFDQTIRVEIRSRGGVLAHVAGDPAQARVVKVLHPWSQVVHAWAWRNWCRSRRHRVIAVVTISGMKPERNLVFKLPRCRNRLRRSRLVSIGTSRSGLMVPRTNDPIPAHFVPRSVPIPPSPALLRYRNGWEVGDGRSLVAVYAGAEGDDPRVGMFVVLHEHDPVGYQNWHRVYVPGTTGPVTITEAPLGKKVETSAQRAKLEFVSKSGARGTLDLDGDAVTLDSG